MRIVIFIALIAISIRASGQIIELPLPLNTIKENTQIPPSQNKDRSFAFDERLLEKEAKMQLSPNQKIEFEIEVNSANHQVFICDTSGNVLFKQKKGRGLYTCTTNRLYKYVMIYELDKSGHKQPVSFDPVSDFKRKIIWGKGKKIDGIVTITAIKNN